MPPLTRMLARRLSPTPPTGPGGLWTWENSAAWLQVGQKHSIKPEVHWPAIGSPMHALHSLDLIDGLSSLTIRSTACCDQFTQLRPASSLNSSHSQTPCTSHPDVGQRCSLCQVAGASCWRLCMTCKCGWAIQSPALHNPPTPSTPCAPPSLASSPASLDRACSYAALGSWLGAT